MFNRILEGRTAWLLVGVVAGLCLAYFWPHEPVLATATDRNDKFAIVTAPVEQDGSLEAVFVLDFLTGRLSGAVLNKQGTGFGALYFRNIASDFKIDPEQTSPKYAMVSGRAFLQQRGGAQWGASTLYVSELASGMVACYRIPYVTVNRKVAKPVELVPLDNFPFRAPAQSE